MYGITLILGLAVILGLPTWLVTSSWKRAENEETTPPTDEIIKLMRKGSFLSSWGIDFIFGVMPIAGSMIAWSVKYFDTEYYFKSLSLTVVVSVLCLIIGFSLLMTGKTIMSCQSRRLEHIKGRERNDVEELIVAMICNLEGRGSSKELKNTIQNINLANAVARATSTKIDDIAMLSINAKVLSGFRNIIRFFTGDNFLKNHWPWIIIILATAAFVVMAII